MPCGRCYCRRVAGHTMNQPYVSDRIKTVEYDAVSRRRTSDPSETIFTSQVSINDFPRSIFHTVNFVKIKSEKVKEMEKNNNHISESIQVSFEDTMFEGILKQVFLYLYDLPLSPYTFSSFFVNKRWHFYFEHPLTRKYPCCNRILKHF